MAEARLDQLKIVFAVINQTPDDAGWIEIAAIKADHNTQIVPIDDALIQRGREQQQEWETLDECLKRFLGRRQNLYDVRDPVVDRLNFFGREALAAELLATIAAGQPIALFGLRKMGKSSLLQHLRNRTPFPVAHVDLLSGTELSLLYDRILKSLQNSLRVKTTNFVWEPPTLSSRDPSTGFTAIISDLMDKLERSGHLPQLGIFVDEIERIVPRTKNGDIDADAVDRYLAFAGALRGLVQETRRFSILVVGVDPFFNRENRFASQQNPFALFFREQYLEPLSRDDCVQMVRNIGRQMNLFYSAETIAFIAHISGGHPFLARQLCSTAYQIIDHKTGEITLKQMQDAAELFVADPNTEDFLNERGLWGEVTNTGLWPPSQIVENKALLTSLAEVENQSKNALLNSTQTSSTRERERSLFELEQLAVLGQSKRLLRIQFGLFRNWIRRYKL